MIFKILQYEEVNKTNKKFIEELDNRYPLIKEYIIKNEDDFYGYFSIEQLDKFEESLHLYYETEDIDTNEFRELYLKSNKTFNNDIICLSEGMIDYYDFILDYRVEPQTYYDFALGKVIEYFKENKIKDLMDYGSDSDFGLISLSDMYKEIMQKLDIKYENVYTENVSDGKYRTTIILENNPKIVLDISAWNGIKTVAENVESVYAIYDMTLKKDSEIDYDYE